MRFCGHSVLVKQSSSFIMKHRILFLYTVIYINTPGRTQRLWLTGILCGRPVGLKFPSDILRKLAIGGNSFRQSLFATY